MKESEFRSKVGGVLLGTAIGDALGVVAEGLSAEHIRRRFGKISSFRLLPNHGIVTDDTEQAALVAFSLARNPLSIDSFLKDFRRSLVLWYLCLPFGLGRATLQACLRLAIGLKNSGVKSAGNGAAMRAAVIGTYFFDEPELRREYGTKAAEVTHCDRRAVEGALFVAEMAAACLQRLPEETLLASFAQAVEVVSETDLRAALEKAAELATKAIDTDSAAKILNGRPYAFILNSLPFATFCFLRFGDGNVLGCLSETIAGGGDTDTNAAIVGSWLGALAGESGLPSGLIARLDDGPFGPSHLRQLADSLQQAKYLSGASKVPGYSLPHAALRNVLVVPVILGHALLRILPAPGNKG